MDQGLLRQAFAKVLQEEMPRTPRSEEADSQVDGPVWDARPHLEVIEEAGPDAGPHLEPINEVIKEAGPEAGPFLAPHLEVRKQGFACCARRRN